MADMNRKKSVSLRTDPEFKKLVLELSRLKSAQENDEIKATRITQAMLNQYKKYPDLLKEIKESKLGKWKSK